MGQVGYRVVSLLCRLGEPVTVLTLSARDEWLAEAQARGAEVRLGDARDARRLVDAGIHEACALIAATSHDLTNLEVALDAKQLEPDLPIVLRLFDQALAAQLEARFGVRRALGMSTLAAPRFAAAAFGEELIGSFALDGRLFVIGSLTLDEACPLAPCTAQEVGAGHRLATLAHTTADGKTCAVPPPDTHLREGDRVTVIGDLACWDRLTRPDADGTPAASLRQRFGRLGRALRPAPTAGLLRRAWNSTPVGLRMVFVILNALILFSVLVFHYAMSLSWVDALYFVITTVTTVGYGDITPHDAGLAVKLYGCVLMLLGSATIGTLYWIITDFIVTARFEQLLGRQHVPQADHIVVVGLGNVGYRVVEELRRTDTPIVAVERQPAGEFVEAVRGHVPLVIGDARVRDTLVKAGVPRARGVIAATDDEIVNLSVGLATEQMNPHARTVVRLFDPDLARKAQAELGIDAVISASLLAAPTFVAAALYPDVRYAVELEGCLVAICHRPAGEEWHGLTPGEVRATHETMILMRQRAAGSFTPAHDDTPLDRAERVVAVAWRTLAK
jgi:Trk K+ transport system NAD-binding subunit